MIRLLLSSVLALAFFIAASATSLAHTVESRCAYGYYQERYASIKPVQPYWAGNHLHTWSPWYNVAYGC